MTRFLIGLTALGAAMLGSAAWADPLLVNGSFEAGPALNSASYYRGTTPPTGWNAIIGVELPDIVGNGYTQSGAGFQVLLGALDGTRFLDMNGASPSGGLYQNITGLTPGAALSLTFYTGRWAQNSAGYFGATVYDLSSLSSIAAMSLSYAYLPGATSSTWDLQTLDFIVPSSGSVRVQFIAQSPSTSHGAPGLDNVSLNAVSSVPEASTWAMMVMGFGLLGGALRRRGAPVPAIA